MTPPFLSGVVEGFYGRPWTFAQRHKLVGWLQRFGLNTYVFAPKDDLKHRVLWRELLDKIEAAAFGELIAACAAAEVRFHYALAPAWDEHFSGRQGTGPGRWIEDLLVRFKQLSGLGCRQFAVLFDDVPGLNEAERSELARRHAGTANRLVERLATTSPGATLLLCPAIYCARLAGGPAERCEYLVTLGRELAPEIDIFWTGPDVISATISAEHLREINGVLRRRVLLWDNLFANDYDLARPHLGPYVPRTGELPHLARGVLLNPNCQFDLNFVPLAMLGEFLRDPHNPPAAIPDAILEWWLPEWQRHSGTPFPSDLIRSLVECFDAPFHRGPAGERLLELARRSLAGDPAARKELHAWARRFAELFHDLATLNNRDLLNALWSPVWHLKDELTLVAQLAERTGPGPHALPDFVPGIARGGLLHELRQLTRVTADGRFSRIDGH